MLERFFPAAEPGRRRRTGEEPMPFPMGSLPGYQQGPLAWDLPEMIKMVKLVWKSKGELRGAKHRGVLESEDAAGGSAGRFFPTLLLVGTGGANAAGSRRWRRVAAVADPVRRGAEWLGPGAAAGAGRVGKARGPGSAARRASGFNIVLLAALALSPRGHAGVCAGAGRAGSRVPLLTALSRAICCLLLSPARLKLSCELDQVAPRL